MDAGAGENATRLAWRSAPELLINEESLVDVITKLRAQVLALERNELLSGTALPPWLLRSLTDVANNVDAVVECQAMHEQVNGLQKEVLELRHELLLQQSAVSTATTGGGGGGMGYSPTPHHRLSAGTSVRGNSSRLASMPKGLNRVASGTDSADPTTDTTAGTPTPSSDAAQLNLEKVIKPLWDAIHKQTNAFSALKQDFSEAKETVARLQSEIKRRDAVVQARNAKHESVVQSQVEKINEAMRACVTRNDLIAAEQRIAQQMKIDRQHVLDEVDSRSNKILEDLLASRSDQEDINSQHAEQMETVARKQARMEDHVIELMKKHTEGQENINEMRMILSDAVSKVDTNSSTMDVFQEKFTSFEETQSVVRTLSEEMQNEKTESEQLRIEQEERLLDKMGETATAIRSELAAVNSVVTELVEMNFDSEIKALESKLEVVQLNVADVTRKIGTQQKQLTTHEDYTKTQFTQVFDSLDRVLANMSSISEESMRLSFNLNQSIEHGHALQCEVTDYKTATDASLQLLHRSAQDVQSGLDKHVKLTENEVVVIKNQLFHVEDAQSTLRRDLEATQRDVYQNLRSQIAENARINTSLETLCAARDDLSARQDAAQAQMVAMQADNRLEIQQATLKLVAVVDKESDRVEALYRSFQEKQDHFADVVARSSIRNMDLPDMNRELDRICELFVTECWKFEISSRTKTRDNNQTNNSSSGPNNAAPVTRKLFHEKQQQLLARNCQFFADLLVARAEYEVLHTGCNKETKNQSDLDDLMLDTQTSITEKMKSKIQTKIMNNKNIGEQFDKSTLDRRELYIETLSNIIEASMKRRTLCGSGNNRRSGARQSVFGELAAEEPAATGASFLETQRLVGTGSALGGSRRKSLTRKPSTMGMGIMGSPGGLTSDLDANRVGFSPSSAYVYRAGFRLPKATQSPLNSPGDLSPAPSTAGLLNGRLGTAMAALSETSEPPLFLTATFDADGLPTGDGIQSWSGDDTTSNGLAKSISLPVLRQ